MPWGVSIYLLVVPDLVVVKRDEGYDVVLSEDGLPNVKISPYYHHLLKNTSEAKTKEYLKKKHQAAEFLIKSIDKRRETIYKVGKSIVKLQIEFRAIGRFPEGEFRVFLR